MLQYCPICSKSIEQVKRIVQFATRGSFGMAHAFPMKIVSMLSAFMTPSAQQKTRELQQFLQVR
jgi:hypothetical protein